MRYYFWLTLISKSGKIDTKMFINHTSKQVTAKIVYYGTGLSGKTTNLQYIYSITNPNTRGELISMETDIERTLFFDLLPIDVGSINGYLTKFQLYTVPGQIFYDSTRKIVLKGVDGIVFVGDSQELMIQGNIDSFENLKKNLIDQNIDINTIPLVIQYNKRDLKNILPVDVLNKNINSLNAPYFEAVATKGDGVIQTLKSISSLTLGKIKKEIDSALIPTKKFEELNFDINKKNEILRIEDIPRKVISVDEISDMELQIEIEPDSKDLKIQKTEQIQNEKKPEIKLLKKESEVKILDSNQIIPKKPKKKEAFSLDSLKILNDLNDNSRKTIIKKLKFTDNKNFIEIKNSNSELINTFELNIDSKTKKITIIIDVQK